MGRAVNAFEESLLALMEVRVAHALKCLDRHARIGAERPSDAQRELGAVHDYLVRLRQDVADLKRLSEMAEAIEKESEAAE